MAPRARTSCDSKQLIGVAGQDRFGRRHQDRIRLAASGPAIAAPPQKMTSATTIMAVATVPRAATPSGRNGTPSRRTQRTSDALISTTPTTAHGLARGGARTGARPDVSDGDAESVT